MKQTRKENKKHKKHLPMEEKLSILRKLGPNPSKLRVQTMSAQYNVRSQTIQNWILNGLGESALTYKYKLDKKSYKSSKCMENFQIYQQHNPSFEEENEENNLKDYGQDKQFCNEFTSNQKYNSIIKVEQGNIRKNNQEEEESEQDIEIIL